MKHLFLTLTMVNLASCYGPSIKTIKCVSGTKISKAEAINNLSCIEGCKYKDFVILEINDKGIIFEDQRKITNIKTTHKMSEIPSPCPAPIGHDVSDCKDVGAMALEILFGGISSNESTNSTQYTEERKHQSTFLLTWSNINEVEIVYPVSNVLLSFSLVFLILPRFYLLYFYHDENKLLFSVFPHGQFKKNFIITSKFDRNYEYCKLLAKSVFIMKEKD